MLARKGQRFRGLVDSRVMLFKLRKAEDNRVYLREFRKEEGNILSIRAERDR